MSSMCMTLLAEALKERVKPRRVSSHSESRRLPVSNSRPALSLFFNLKEAAVFLPLVLAQNGLKSRPASSRFSFCF